MSEHDETNKQYDFKKHFIDIVEFEDTRDVGITDFDEMMMDCETQLNKDFVGKTADAYEEIDETQVALTDQWFYTNSIARVSGRVYVSDPSLTDMLPEEWGETLEDVTSGEEYYFLDGARLRSKGVVVMPITDENMLIERIRIGYAYSYVDEDVEMDEPLFIAYPGELSEHQYEIPTPAEAEFRLANKWPKEYELLQKLAKPNLQMALPARIENLAAHLREAMAKDKAFCDLVEIYLDESLKLSQQFPYLIVTDESVSCFEGEGDPFDDPDDGAWTKVSLKHPLTAELYAPMIRCFADKNGEYHLKIVGRVYNEDDDDEPEYVRFDPSSVSQFRSTRAQQSILDRVIALVAEDDVDGNYLVEAVKAATVAEIEGGISPDEAAPSPMSEELRQMSVLKDELAQVARLINNAQQQLYKTQAEAYAASSALVNEVVRIMLETAGINNKFPFTFSGLTVKVPNRIHVEGEMDKLPNMYIYGVDKEEKLASLSHGDTIDGTVEAITPLVRFESVEGEVTGYSVNPSLFIKIAPETKVIAEFDGVNLVEIMDVSKGFVPLDGSAEIQLPRLEYYNNVGEFIDKAAIEYGKHPVVDELRELRTKFGVEIAADFTELDSPRLLSGMQEHIESIIAQGMKPSLVITSLEALIVDKYVRVVGEVHPVEGYSNGVARRLKSGDLVNGVIVDVTHIPSRGGLNITIKLSGSDYVYIPLASISQFSF